MNLFDSFSENENNFLDFLDRNPEDKELDVFLLNLQNFIKAEFSLNSVFLGYNLLTPKILEDPNWSIWNYAKIGHTATIGFGKNTLETLFSQNLPIYLCYIALPINSEDYLIEREDILDWEFEEFLSSKLQTNVISIGAVKKDNFDRCRTFKFLFQKQKSIFHQNLFSVADLDNFKFLSSSHIRYDNGLDLNGRQSGVFRVIEIISHESIQDAYRVTIYNMDSKHPVWGNNIQMAPKRMKIIYKSNNKIELKGFGYDKLGVPFSRYGITIFLKNNNEIEKIVLHIFDRKIDIEYF